MKTLYLDIFSGISGDMFVGAMIDLGVDLHQLEKELGKLGLNEYHLHAARQQRAQITGTKFDVHLEQEHEHGPDHHHDEHQHEHERAHEHENEHEHGHSHDREHDDHGHEHDPDHAHAHTHGHPHTQTHAPTHGHVQEHPHTGGAGAGTALQAGHSPRAGAGAGGSSGEGHAPGPGHGRSFRAIRQLNEGSSLSDWVRQKSVAMFRRIAVAEGKIHGAPPDEVHFHEVGAVDSIVDLVGACVALEMLGKPRVLAGPVVEGTGWIYCAHGSFPLPAPATLEILAARGVAVTQCTEAQELVTPTGAALLAELAESFAPMRELKPERIGYGLGTRENKTRPNVLRAVLGQAEAVQVAHDWEVDTVAVLQANLDDANPELLGGMVEKALSLGALDVFHIPIQMKKSRPGVLLTLLCAQEDADRFSEWLLRETTTFGVRRQWAERRKLARELVSVETPFGQVTLKLGRLDGLLVQTAPEYESCKRVAERANVPLKQVYEAAIRAAPQNLPEL